MEHNDLTIEFYEDENTEPIVIVNNEVVSMGLEADEGELLELIIRCLR